jgi:non-ribosomal peptide synthetase component E (peptide arylation enzyme)
MRMPNTLLTLFDTDRYEEYYRTGFWRDDTVYALVRAHADRTPDRIAVRSAQGDIAYSALLEYVDLFADDLARAGVIAGQRVAVWLPSRPETVIALLACSRNAYVCCPSLHRDHTVGDIIGLLKRMRAAALVAEAGHGADGTKHDLFAQVSGVDTIRKVYRLEKSKVGKARADAARAAKRQPHSLSRLYLWYDRRAQGSDAQRQYAARQCARAVV